MGIHIPSVLEGILEATAAEAAAKARIATLRAALEDEARRRLDAEGAAPSWNTPSLGKVRLDPPSEWLATVADPVTFGSFVAEHYPTEATAIIPIPAADLADALQALEFISVKPAGEVRVEVRSAWEEAYVKGLTVDVEEVLEEDGSQVIDRTITVVDTEGLLVDGMTATRKPAKLVVSLDRDRRTAAITEARASADALLEDAAGDDAPDADPAELHRRRVELEGMGAAILGLIAKAHGLGSSGTKAELAERIARAEIASGNVIRTADQLEAPPTPEPLPDDAEVEEVTTIEEPVKYPHPVSVPAEDLPDEGAARTVGEHIADERLRDDLDKLSREVLRGYAKSVGISAAGTKGELLDRLVEAGAAVSQVNAYAAAARA